MADRNFRKRFLRAPNLKCAKNILSPLQPDYQNRNCPQKPAQLLKLSDYTYKLLEKILHASLNPTIILFLTLFRLLFQKRIIFILKISIGDLLLIKNQIFYLNVMLF